MKVSSVLVTTNNPCCYICNDWISILGKSTTNSFKFDIPLNIYLSIQDLSYPDILELFPGLKMFHEILTVFGMKGFGKLVRKVKERGDKVTTIKILRIRIRAKSIYLNDIVYQFNHELYNILPTFLIPYKRYIADHIFKCAAHNRKHVIDNSEEFPSTRQTFKKCKETRKR